ncbi:MAG: hypothetical protein ACOCWF_00780, partial [Halochromatium sp.]
MSILTDVTTKDRPSLDARTASPLSHSSAKPRKRNHLLACARLFPMLIFSRAMKPSISLVIETIGADDVDCPESDW